ncbi:MAG TPA: PilZ domain-containing protein [Terriglobales bacterium]|nr:PilZ domain-containing protein [Terriglobales bacterium]
MPANSMGASDKTQHAIRRSTRLPLEVPVLVTSLESASPFSLQCNTTLVNAHGCGLIVPRAFAQGIQVRLEIVSAKRHTTARVAEVVPLGGDPETWLVGLELDAPGNFWGIEYAPADWKIEESPAPVVVRSRTDPESSTTAKPAPARRWRLTDISAGACYLETSAPFPADTPVLLSIRAADTECLLDGVVRVSHEQTGMGVEFTGAQAHERRAKVEELIGRLTSQREVPKIFVGRKEDRKEGKKEAQPAPNAGPRTVPEADVLDPLLQLIRGGASLGMEQFLNDLRAQRLGDRRDARIELALPVLLTGTDITGRPLNQRVMTINISRRGALLDGIHGMLGRGDIISLTRLQKKEQFRVAWVGAEATPAAGQIGVAAVDPNSSFWSEVLDAAAQSGLETASLRGDTGRTSP